MNTKSRSSQRNLRTRGLLLLPLIYSTSAFVSKKGVQYRIKCQTSKVCLHVVRRPQRPESTEKKRAERKAIIETRQQDALQDPTLLTDLSFTECKQLHQSSKRAIIEGMGHQTMTEVQAKTFSAALAGKDILARARTGTGKTLAFLIPVVERILSNPIYVPGKSISCLVMAPTRELAMQIGEEADKLLMYHPDLSVQVMYGGVSMARDMNAFNKRLPSILISTPGRLLDHLQETKVRGRKFNDDIMANTDILVLDEFDRLLDTGFRRETRKILSYLPRKEKRQTMLFSATISSALRGDIREVLRDDFVEVDCVQNGTMATITNLRVSQSHVILPKIESIIPSIYTILRHATTQKPHKVVVFFPTARMVSFFADVLCDGFQHPILELHSKKSQSSRNTASESFRLAKNAILFTSDVSARGLDYPDVTQVIQIGIPESRDHFIHRLGRTARAGKEGTGILILFPFESHFLSELNGIDVPRDSEMTDMLQESSKLEVPKWMVDNSLRIQRGGNKLAASAQLAYLSFLGYYLGQVKRIHLNKSDIVALSNEFSKSIGLESVPTLSPKLISKLNLDGVSGVERDVVD